MNSVFKYFQQLSSKYVTNTLKHLKVTLGTQSVFAIPLSNVVDCPCQNLEVRESVGREFDVPREKRADPEGTLWRGQPLPPPPRH